MEVYQACNGFIGSTIGSYVTREGEHGVVLQQVGSREVRVYPLAVLEKQPPTVIIAEESNVRELHHRRRR
jgi:hypothetical protein